MEYILSDQHNHIEEKFIIDNLWLNNNNFSPVDIHPLRITMKEKSGETEGGIIARTWWRGLDIQYLWIADVHRGKGKGRLLMTIAEEEAIKRNCCFSYVDTLSFQAKGFYEKLGYAEYGSLDGFADIFSRHYLVKSLRL